MIDYGQRQTDAVISQMDRVIADIYRQTEEELQKKLDDYLARFKIKDAIKCEMLQKGEITLEEYNYWRTGQIMIGKRWEEMRDTLAQDLHNSNNIARSVVNGYTPEVYALNHNYATFQVEKVSLVDTSYTLYDRQTVERIMRSNPDLLPPPGPRKKAEIAAGKDIKWQSRQLQSAMTKSILAGDSIPHIAKRLSNELSVTNRKAAERYARTAATGAQNAGRVDAYRRAQDMGIEMEQEWLATLDDRTRHEHRYLDGQHVPVGEPFTVDGYELRFPGDPAGPGYLIWNCRCTLVPRLKNLDQSDAPRDSKLGDMSYDEWKQGRDLYHDEPSTSLHSTQVVNGKNILQTWQRRPDQFDFEIDDIINAQGFDGLPRVVSEEEFDSCVKESRFIAQRTYSAPNKETLDAYREQLYGGKWYVDCSNGGAHYGQGMYCAADYNGVLSDSIRKEMRYYGAETRKYSNVETFTLTSDAKIISYDELHNMQMNVDMLTRNTANAVFEKYSVNNEAEKMYLLSRSGAYIEDTSAARDWMRSLNKDERESLNTLAKTVVREITGRVDELQHLDIGAFGALQGYDVINAENGMHTVILNRTKVIFRRPYDRI